MRELCGHLNLDLIEATELKSGLAVTLRRRLAGSVHVREFHVGRMARVNRAEDSDPPTDDGTAVVSAPSKAKNRHQKQKSGKTAVPSFTCPICGLVIKYSSNYSRHIQRQHKGKSVPCPKCDKRFRDNSELRNHLESGVHMAPKPVYTCATCGGKYTSQRALLHHSHDRVRAFPCDICRRKFQTAVVCAAHRRRHFWRGLARCRACSATFATEEHLSRHIRNHERETAVVVRY